MFTVNERRQPLLLLTTAILVTTSFMAIIRFSNIEKSFAVESHSVGVYWDPNCTEEVTSIDWGPLRPSSTTAVKVFVRNEEAAPSCNLWIRTENWTPPETSDSVTLFWESDMDTIDLGEVTQVTLSLRVAPIVSSTDFTFHLLVSGAPIRGDLVVRGLDDRIYYRSYDLLGGSWNSWHVVPSGVTSDSPTAAVWSGRLYIVVRGLDGTSLWFGWINLVNDAFSGWEWMSGATSSAPTLVCHGTRLILVVRGLDNRVYYRVYNCPSGEWGPWKALPSGATCDSPAAAVLDGSLHMVVRGFSKTNADTNNSLWHATLDLTTETFSGWSWLPGSTPSAPTTTASQTWHELYLIVHGLDNRIYYNLWKNSEWEGWESVSSGTTSDSPAGVIIGDELHIIVRGFTGTSLWHYSIDKSASQHSGWEYITGATPSAPTLTY